MNLKFKKNPKKWRQIYGIWVAGRRIAHSYLHTRNINNNNWPHELHVNYYCIRARTTNVQFIRDRFDWIGLYLVVFFGFITRIPTATSATTGTRKMMIIMDKINEKIFSTGQRNCKYFYITVWYYSYSCLFANRKNCKINKKLKQQNILSLRYFVVGRPSIVVGALLFR